MAKTISCMLNKNLTKELACNYSLNQVVDIYLAEFAQASQASAITMANGEYSVSAISEDLSWAHIEPQKDSASYADTLVVGGNGAKYRNHSLTFSFAKVYDEDMAKAIDALSLGKYVALLKVTSGEYIMLGRLTGLEATVAESVAEAAADGNQGLNVTMEGNTVESAVAVPKAVGDAIKLLS